MKRLAYILGLLPLFAACSGSTSQNAESKDAAASDFEVLAEWMQGSFSSAAQAEADSNYFDIRLEMVPIWTDRNDGPWYYVEQAAAGYLDRPYRQRVYHLTETETGMLSEIYALPGDPLAYAGDFADEAPLAALSPDSLVEREGCGVWMSRQEDGTFAGATEENSCVSTLRGASWATSKVEIFEDKLVSWDQGWDSLGNQVWGAENGGYVFLKVEKSEDHSHEGHEGHDHDEHDGHSH